MTLFVIWVVGDCGWSGEGSWAQTMYCSLSMSFAGSQQTFDYIFLRSKTYHDSYDWVMIGVVYVVGKFLDDSEHVRNEFVLD